MSFDAAKNLAKVTVLGAHSAGDTTVALKPGHAVKLPAVPFNVTWWNSTDYGDPSDDPNVEIVRVTTIVGDTLTVTRAQEGTTASTKSKTGKTYKMLAGFTAAMYSAMIGQLALGPVNGSHALGNNAEDGTVTGLALTFVPSRVTLSISRPSGGLNIMAFVNTGSLSTDGFTFELSGMTDSTSYVLDYVIYP